MKHGIGLVLVVLLLVAGCGRARLAPRYLSRCPATGPESAADLDLRRAPVELEAFYAALWSRAQAFEIAELGLARDAAYDYPILAIRHRGADARRNMLIVTGVHGNEGAGLLAVPGILDLLETDRPELAAWEVTILVPANPVGAAHGSRYNADGCDLNRDFRDPRSDEARLIRDFIEAAPPDLVVSLHEGPQDGFLLVVTSNGEEALGKAVVRAVQEAGIGLASAHFAGFSLGTPGLSAEGRGTDFLKWLLRLHTLGRFANGLGIGTYTTETSWSSEDLEERTLAHVLTIEALLIAGARDGAAER